MHVELGRARESALLTPGERQELDGLVAHFDPKDRDAVDEFLDPLFVSGWVARLVHHRLQAVGFYDQLRRIPAVDVVARVFESASLPTQDSAKEAGNQLWQWLLAKWRARE